MSTKKYVNLDQKKFEECIELLILYKKNNLNKEVYLNEQSINEALKWFHEKQISN